MAGQFDLEELIDSVKSEVNPPGQDLFPEAADPDWVLHLQNGFWEAVLDGLIEGYDERDGIVSPSRGSTVLPRQLQQLVVFYAGMRVTKARLMDLKTSFRTVAGPVEYEVQQSAQVLKAVYDDLIARRNLWLRNLARQGIAPTFVIDGVIARTDSIGVGDTFWYGV